MIIILFDNEARQTLYPFTETKAVADIRCGIFTAKERWELISGLPVYIHAPVYLSGLYENFSSAVVLENDFLFIDASVKDEAALRTQILSLETGAALYDDVGLIAGRTISIISDFSINSTESFFENISVTDTVKRLQFPWQIFQWNDEQLRRDFLLLFSRKQTQLVPGTNQIIQPESIIIDEGASVEHCIINASAGPVYIGKNVTVMEGSLLRGPIGICENAVIKMGTKIYGATTIGPFCTVGGEIKNSVLQSFSNKAHDGYLGDAVIGSWCNLGAGTSNSNVKNSAADVLVDNNNSSGKINTGKKCGVLMGDYSRTSINTSINTGSVIGVCCNIFDTGLTPGFIKNFSWGFSENNIYNIDKAIEHINNWQALKEHKLSGTEISVLRYIFENRQ